jgi:hypothetical protein
VAASSDLLLTKVWVTESAQQPDLFALDQVGNSWRALARHTALGVGEWVYLAAKATCLAL